MDPPGTVVVSDLLPWLRRWQARVIAGHSGQARPVTGVVTMRARIPAFDRLTGGEVVLLAMATLRSLVPLSSGMTLPAMVKSLANEKVAGIAVAGLPLDASLPPDEQAAVEHAITLADQLGMPMIALGHVSPLAEVASALVDEMRRWRERPPLADEHADQYATRVRASLREEALEALLTGTYVGESQMRERAFQLGHDLARPYVVLRIELDPAATFDGARGPNVVNALAASVAEQVTISLSGWTSVRGGGITAMLPLADSPSASADLAERARALLARAIGPDMPWCAGLGEKALGPSQARRTATEAADAAQLGMLVFGGGRVARLSDLGIYRLLLHLRDSGELEPFVTQTLAPLAPETKAGEALVESLEAYFACSGNVTGAARQLVLHRNTMLYRLNQAEKRLGHKIDDPERRLALELAIKARFVLHLGRR